MKASLGMKGCEFLLGFALGALLILILLLTGCAAYQQSRFTPNNMTLGENFDDHGHNRSHYIGFDFPLKP